MPVLSCLLSLTLFKYRMAKLESKPLTDESLANDALNRILRAYRTKVRRYTEPGSSFSTEATMGCSREKLREHISSLMTPEMTWENYGSVWCFTNSEAPSAYDLTQVEQLLGYFSYTSFKPRLMSDFPNRFVKGEGVPTPKSR